MRSSWREPTGRRYGASVGTALQSTNDHVDLGGPQTGALLNRHQPKFMLALDGKAFTIKESTMTDATDGVLFGDLYARWTLDWLIEIAHAVAHDYVSRPDF